MPQVFVADVLCGGGKTSAAINYINASPPESKFIFITPYLPECTRIVECCKGHLFVQPAEETKGRKKTTKLADMRTLLQRKCNIASTHALFPRYTEDMLEMIRQEHYTLIIDEAYEMIKAVSKRERALFYDELGKGTISTRDEGQVFWTAPPPSRESELFELYRKTENGAICLYGKSILVWRFPPEILRAFDQILILTYMFDAQTFRYYLDRLGILYTYIGTKRTEPGYVFCDKDDPDIIRQAQFVKDRIHILDTPKLNLIGSDDNALSASWYQRDAEVYGKRGIMTLAKNIRNVQKNIYKCPIKQFMWTTYKDYEDDVKDKNLKNTFVAWNQRAVNKYRDCQYLAYGINLYAQPDAYSYFARLDIHMDTERWALSEMIQWIWRSAIRDGKEIWVYIPSKRMRTLLKDWIAEVSMPQPADKPGLSDKGDVA